MTDEQLFARFRRDRDPAALAALFDRTASALYRSALHLCGDLNDADDLVQETFVAAIEHADAFGGGSVRGWLLGVLANRAARLRRAAARPPVHRPPADEPDPAAAAERNELWSELAHAIESLPAVYRTPLILHLRYGHHAVEIAHALGLPPGTVRCQLSRGMELLRRALPAGVALSAAAALTLPRGLAAVRAALVGPVGPAPLAATALQGGLLMKKIAAAGAAALLVVVIVWLAVARAATTPQGRPPAPAGALAAETAAARYAAGEDGAPRNAVAGQKAPATTGALRVVARFTAELAPAAGVHFELVPSRHARLGALHAREGVTDADGTRTVGGLPPGEVLVRAARGGDTVRARVIEGAQTDVVLDLPAGLLVGVEVVDEGERPIAGAHVWISASSLPDDSGRIVATTGHDGRCVLTHVAPRRRIAAFARGYRRSGCVQLEGEPGARIAVRLKMQGGASALTGTVHDERGGPVAGACVLVGTRRQIGLLHVPAIESEEFPPAFELRTDEGGSFRADGVAPGAAMPLWVRAPGFAAAQRTVEIAEHGDTHVRVDLQRGVTLAGLVRGPDGRSFPRARISVEDATAPAQGIVYLGPAWAGRVHVTSGADGCFAVDGLGAGTIRAFAKTDDAGSASFEATAAPGERLRWEAVLAIGGAITGLVTDGDGAPRPGWKVWARADNGRDARDAVTDAEGRFRLGRCEAETYALAVCAPGSWPHALARAAHVAPGGDPVHLRILGECAPSAFLTGEVTGPADAELPATVEVEKLGTAYETAQAVVGMQDGRFRAGPLPAGSYRLRCESPTHGLASAGPVALAPGETRDAGALQLAAPGSLRARWRSADGRPLPEVTFSVARVEGPWATPRAWSHRVENDVVLADRLGPGSWLLQAYGRGIPVQRFPFEVQPGGAVILDIEVRRGVVRGVRLPPPSAGLDVLLSWRWTRDGEVVQQYRDRWFRSEAVESEWTLLPGSYVIDVEDEHGRRATSRFVVGDAPRADEVIVIRLP